MARCMSVRLSHAGILCKRLNYSKAINVLQLSSDLSSYMKNLREIPLGSP